jgi:hypothetical protein
VRCHRYIVIYRALYHTLHPQYNNIHLKSGNWDSKGRKTCGFCLKIKDPEFVDRGVTLDIGGKFFMRILFVHDAPVTGSKNENTIWKDWIDYSPAPDPVFVHSLELTGQCFANLRIFSQFYPPYYASATGLGNFHFGLRARISLSLIELYPELSFRSVCHRAIIINQLSSIIWWGIQLTDVLMEKMNTIEQLLLQLNTKIDNFLGYEILSEEEQKELDQVREEIKSGESVPMDQAF